LVHVSMLINRELTRSFIAQHASKNIHLFLSQAEFEYLKNRLRPDIQVYTKRVCQQLSSHVSVQLEKVLNYEWRNNIFEWTPSSSSRNFKVFSAAQSL
jgi:hypothetical protein